MYGLAKRSVIAGAMMLTFAAGCNFVLDVPSQPDNVNDNAPVSNDNENGNSAPPQTPPGREQPDPSEPPAGQPIELFSLTIDVVGDGTVEPAGGPVASGTILSLVATPADGWRFAGWTGDLTSDESTFEVTIESDVALTATFVQQFALTVVIEGNGSVEIDPPTGPYDADTLVTVIATADAGSQFDGWQGDLTSDNPAETITMDGEKQITAVFSVAPPGGGVTPPVIQNVTLTVATIGDGAVEITPSGTPVASSDGQGFLFPIGTQVSLSAVNSAGGCFFRWGGDLDRTDATVQLTLSDDEVFVLAEFTDVFAPPPAPALDAHTTLTNENRVTITGRVPTCQNDAAGIVEITGPAGSLDAAVVNGAFTADVPLSANRTNQLFFTAVSAAGVRGMPTTTVITHDGDAPTLFIDFPPDGSELTNDAIDVAGRVSDVLTGFMGLAVTVGGMNAVVDVGIGTNGTFERQAVPLAMGDNVITATATDMLGNTIERSITVTRVEIPAGAPMMEVVSGNGQSASIHSFLADPVRVRITRGDGSPFVAKPVTFRVTRSDGRLGDDPTAELSMTLQAITDADGVAEARWRLGADAGCGNNRIEVTSTSIVGTTFFCASATNAPPAQINVGTGNNQRAETGGPAPEPLRVWVNDRCNGVPGVPVTFTVVRGDGRVDDRTSVTVDTSDTGHAEVAFTLGGEPGNNVVEANFPNNPTGPVRFVVFGVARDETQPTSFSGLVLNNANQPIQGADCTLTVGGQDFRTASDVDGMFRFDDLPASGPAHLRIDGLVAFHTGGVGGTDVPAGSFPALQFEPVIIPNAENSLPTPVLLPSMNPNNARNFDNTQDVELTVEGLEGLTMIVQAGSMTRADGSVPSPADPAIIALNQVHFDKIPMPMPDGAAPPFAWTLQPSGAKFDPPVKIIYPNMSGLPAGSIAYFLSFNHDTMRFEIITTGSVTDDGANIVTDPGGGIVTAGWGCNCPPYAATGDCEDCESGSANASNGGPGTATDEDQCDECTVSILGATCVRTNDDITFLADPLPEGGTFDWSGGDPVGATDGPIYVTRFATATTRLVSLTYTCDDGQTSLDQVILRVFDDRLVIAGGQTGDVITADLSCSGLENLTLSSTTNSNGFAAKRINSNDANNYVQVLKDTGKFYFVPTTTGTSELTVTGTDPDGDPSGPISITVEFFNVSDGYSSFGRDRVVPGTSQLAIHRIQQRLKYFGFPGKNANPLTVDGLVSTGDSNTRWAIGLFNAAATNSGHSSSSTINAPFINAFNAPRWKRIDSPGGYTYKSGAERHGTSWLEEVFDVAATAHTPGASYDISDISRNRGGALSPHVSHQAGMDVDVDEPFTQDKGPAFFFQVHTTCNGGTNNGKDCTSAANCPGDGTSCGDGNDVVRATGTGVGGATVTNGDLIRQDTTNTFSAVAHGATVPTGWSRQGGLNLVGNEARLTAAYDSDLLVLNTGYDRDALTDQFTALFGATTASGAKTGKILWNDPFFYDGDAGITGATISYHLKHNGHYHVDIAPPTTPTGGGSTATALASSDGPAAARSPSPTGQVDRLDETWTVVAGGQTVQVNPNGSFSIPNIAAPDLFGPGGPGTRPDFVSDDFVRVFAVSTAGGITRYAFSEPFQIVTGETFRVGRFTFVNEPPLFLAESLRITSSDSILFTGGSASLQVTAVLPDGSEVDVTNRSTGTVYRTSNPEIATVAENGVVTATGIGLAYITAVNGGTTAVKRIDALGVAVQTYVEGYVQLADGSPVAGATVTTSLGGESITDNGGFFSVFVEAAANLSVTVTASANIDGTSLQGVSQTVPIRADGITDVGITVISAQFEGLLFAAPILGTGQNPSAVRAGDFDGDGDADLAVVNAQGNDITIRLNNGDGSFADGVDYSTGSFPQGIVVGDFDGDTDLDLAVRNVFGDSVSVFLGDGTGTFAPQVTYIVGDHPTGIVVGDLDGDTDLDLAVATFQDDSVWILKNNGDGTFADAIQYATGDRPSALTVADFDGDNDLDLATADIGTPGGISLLLNQSDGTFPSRAVINAGTQHITVTAGDIDGDGDADLIASRLNLLSVLINGGNATFTEAATHVLGNGLVDIVLPDLNGDGDLDVAVVRSNDDKVSVLLNLGDGSLGNPINVPTADSPRSIAFADLDGDSDVDLAVANVGSSSVSLLFNHGVGAFPRDTSYDVERGARFLAVGDVDNDGDQDLAVVTAGSNTVSVLLNGGSGTFVGHATTPLGCNPAFAHFGDLDADGDLDLVADGCGGFAALMNRGDGSFELGVPYATTPRSPDAATLGDFDGDGDLDVATAVSTSLSIFLNNGDGTFADATVSIVPSSVQFLEAGDTNGDGVPDLVGAFFNATVFILQGNGDGTFSDAFLVPLGFGHGSIAIGDLNGDGANDLALANNSSRSSVSVLINQGNGVFDDEVVYDLSTGASVIRIGDLTGDSRPDLIVTSQQGDRVSVLINQGDGVFGNRVAYQAGEAPLGLAVGDWDGDGDLDAAVAWSSSFVGHVGVMLNRRVSADCNGNSILDDIDVATGIADCNDNAAPDDCDADCNGNSIPDDCEVADGLVDDCNGNGLPDECERDCNSNDIPDDCDLTNGFDNDCNLNGTPDACDLADGSSVDCDGNGRPDECDLDCNGNGVQDRCDVANGSADDCNSNAIPDECELHDPTTSVAMDNCVDAQEVCPGVVYSGSTRLATEDGDGAGECADADQADDVWYVYQPAQDGSATISLCGSSYDTALSIHSRCVLPGRIAELACNDNACGDSSEITLDVVAETEYFIRVSGFDDDHGEFVLTITGPDCHIRGSDCNENGIPDTCEPNASIVFVDDDAAPGGDGESWATAYNAVQDALATPVLANCAGAQIWVAAGVYTPAPPAGDRTATFQLASGVAMLGGFVGNEDPATFDPADRDIVANPAILSGDLNGDDTSGGNPSENSFHVVTASGTNAATVLDGFTITGGNANGPGSDNSGGGMLNDNGSPTLIRCTFIGNSASNGGGLFNVNGSDATLRDCVFTDNTATSGGGVYNDASDPTLTDCLFNGNTGSGGGGGLQNRGGNLILKRCRFVGNTGGVGGGVLSENGDPTFVSCIFDGNSGVLGGGMSILDSSPVLMNCLFFGNSATGGGGALRIVRASPFVTNCTFVGNTTFGSNGGGIHSLAGGPVVTNSILWGNTGGAFGGSGVPLVSFSDVEGGFVGTGNINADPMFVNQAKGDLRLTLGSPCINTGSNDLLPADTGDLDRDGDTAEVLPLDLDARDRIGNNIVDMGAYEFVP